MDEIENVEEVGEVEGNLRYWRAKEAVRHAELRINSQTANLSAMEARATSIFGWAIAGATVLVAYVGTGPYRGAAIAGATSLFVSCGFSIVGLWSKDWGVVGYNPTKILDDTHASELEVLEFIARGYAETINKNDLTLRNFSTFLTLGWITLAVTPIILSASASFQLLSSSSKG